MKVIFLDFDGVINNWDCFENVDFNNVFHLLKIIDLTDAKIVATSSTKYAFQMHGINYENSKFFEYVKMLEKYGIFIFDVTPCIERKRELEIISYLKKHKDIEQFLIMDDDYIFDRLRDHQVFLDLYRGIREDHILPSVNILNGNLGFYPPDFNFVETLEERASRIEDYYRVKRK